MTVTQTTAREAAAAVLETLRERLGADAPERAELLSANAFRIAEAWERHWWARCQSIGAFDTGGWFNAAGPSRTPPPGAKAMTNPNFMWHVQYLLSELQRGDAHYGSSSWPRYRDRAWRQVADAGSAAIRLLEQWDR